MKRTLHLKRDTLSELTARDLREVVGADHTYTQRGVTCPVLVCLKEYTVGCDDFSINAC
jgi:hypothetical protein